MIKSEDLCLTFRASHKLTLSTNLREFALQDESSELALRILTSITKLASAHTGPCWHALPPLHVSRLYPSFPLL